MPVWTLGEKDKKKTLAPAGIRNPDTSFIFEPDQASASDVFYISTRDVGLTRECMCFYSLVLVEALRWANPLCKDTPDIYKIRIFFPGIIV